METWNNIYIVTKLNIQYHCGSIDPIEPLPLSGQIHQTTKS